MLSVAQAAQQLHVSPARVRAMIKDGVLPASKIGRAWALREEDVLSRLASRPRPGRPVAAVAKDSARFFGPVKENERARAAFDDCRELFSRCPSESLMKQARSKEEASFYMAVADFFLQNRQEELIERNVF